MVIQAVADPHGLKRGFAEALAEIQKFERLAAKQKQLNIKLGPSLKKSISEAQKLISRLNADIETETAHLREGLQAGKISQEAYAREGRKAARAFNKALVAGIQDLRQRGLLTPEIHSQLTSQLKKTGLAAGKSFATTARKTIAAHPLLGNVTTQGARAANSLIKGLDATYKQRISAIRTSFAAGLISVNEYRNQGRRAAEAFDQGLVAGRQKLQTRGLLTKNIDQAISGSYKLEGIKAANAFSQSMNKQLAANITQVGATLTAGLTVPIAAAGVATLKLAGNFDLAMAQLEARLRPTTEDMKALTDQARQIGATTQFSAEDAAQAMLLLSKQSLKAAGIMSVMPSVAHLAASELISLTEAADSATTIMFGFGIPFDQLASSIDKFVFVAANSKSTISDLTTAFQYVGPVARTLGVSFSDTAAALGILGKAGLKGTLGGTALRGSLLALVKPSKQALKALDDLGISLRDADGKFRSLREIIGQFELAKATRTAKDFDTAIATIFQNRTFAGFSILMNEGVGALKDFENGLRSSGGMAKRIGDAQMKGFVGQMRELVNVLQELALAIASSGILEMVTNFVKVITNVVRSLSQMNPQLLKTISLIAGILAVVGPLLFSFGKLLTVITLVRAVMISLNITALAGLGTALAVGGPVIVGLTLLGVLLGKIALDAVEAQQRIADFTESLASRGVQQLEQLANDLQIQINIQKTLLAQLEARSPITLEGKRIQSPEITDAINRLKDLEQQLRIVKAEIPKAAQRMKTLEGLGKVDTTSIQALLDEFGDLLSGGEGGEDKLKDFINRVQVLIGLVDALGGELRNQPNLVAAIDKAWAAVNKRLSEQGDALTEDRVQLLNLQKSLQDAMKTIRVDRPFTDKEIEDILGLARLKLQITLTPSINVEGFKQFAPELERFEKLVNDAFQAKINLDIAEMTGDTKFIRLALDAYEKALTDLDGPQKALALAIRGTNLPLKEQEELLEHIQKLLGKVKKESDDAAKAQEKFQRSMEGVANLASGILSIAQAFGEVGESTEKMLEGIAQASRAIADFSRAKAAKDLFGQVTSLFGILGGVVSVLDAIFSKSPLAKEHEDIIRSNTEELAKLRIEIRDFNNTVGEKLELVSQLSSETVQSLLDVLKKGPPVTVGNLIPDVNANKQFFQATADLIAKFREMGFSLEEMAEIARQSGITLLDSHGRIIPQAVEQWREQMQLAAQAATRFKNTVDDQTSALKLRNKAFGIEETPSQVITDTIALFKKFAPELFEKFFAGITSASDPAAQRIAIQRFVEDFIANLIPPELFKGLDKEDVMKFIDEWLDAIGEMTEAANGATESMLNVPQGFKVERARFMATLAEVVRRLDPPPTPAPPPVVPIGGGATPPVTSNTQFIFSEGSIVVDAKDKSAEELVNEISKELKKRSRRFDPTMTAADTLDY